MQQPTKVTLPTLSVLDPRFVYVRAAYTDVQRTWRKHGWFPRNFKRQAPLAPKGNTWPAEKQTKEQVSA